MKKISQRLMSVLMIVLIVIAINPVLPAMAATSTRYTRKFNQWSYKSSDSELYYAGCGLFSTGNAIYAMTGKTIDIAELKKWATSVKGWTASDGLYRYTYFPKLNSSTFAKQYDFTVTGPTDGGITANNKIIAAQLQKGNVAVVVGVPGHFMTITDYDKSTNKYFVIEGAVDSSGRGLEATGWVSESKLSTGNTKVKSYTFFTFNNIIPPVPYTDISEKTYYIKNSSTNTYINASSTTNGGTVSLAAKQTTNAFKMKIAGKNYGGYYITPAVSTDYVLNPWTDSPADGDKITMYKKNTDGHQNWKFEKSGNGYIIHCAYNENVVLTAVGTGIQLKTRTGAANQIWILEDINTTTSVKFHRNLNSDDTMYVTETFTTGVSNQKFGYKTDGTGRYSVMNDASVGFGQWTKPGYKMLGWSKDKNAKTASWKTYSDVTDYWISSNAPSVDLYAVWEQSSLRGDANNDGEVNITDAVILQNWLLGSGDLTNWQNVDLCEDGVIDVFDMVLMRKLITEN